MNNIHQTAIVSGKAKLGDNITAGPFSVIHDDVEIGDNCFIGPSVNIYDGARIGNNVTIYQSASIAHVPQDLKFDKEATLFIVGDNTTIHEFVTLHRGTKETGFSKIGQNCLLMAYTHVAHDCVIGDNVILSNGVQVGGHVTIDDFAIIGGTTPVHQFCHVGRHCMIGGGFRVTQDVPPFILAAEWPLQYKGLNVIGLRRRGFSNDEIQNLKTAYSLVYSNALNISQAKAKIKEDLGDKKYIDEVLNFLDNSKRGIIGK
jgi:UDP-N-acetylglucosamine acyltransferase